MERARIDDTHARCLIADDADDAAEPAGDVIIDLHDLGPTIAFLDETKTPRDGVATLEIVPHHLVFAFDPGSSIGTRMRAVPVASSEEIGPVVRARLTVAFAGRVRDASARAKA